MGLTLKSLAAITASIAVTLSFGACTVIGSGFSGGSDGDDRASGADGEGPAWGMVLGALADRGTGEVPNPLNVADHPGAVACDLGQLGMGWVRIDLGRGDREIEAFQGFVRAARDEGLKVLAVVHARGWPCQGGGCPESEAAWRAEYVDTLGRLIDQDFTGRAAIDAYEITNEPNITGAPQFVEPGAFARLLDAVWREVKLPRAVRGQGPLMVSGGLANSFVSESYWQEMFAALPAGTPPWDVFAVHPYNHVKYETACAPGEASCDPALRWAEITRGLLGEVREKIRAQYPSFFADRRPRIWATEIGWRAGRDYAGGRDQADMFDVTAEHALAGTEQAFWYNYRDDEPVPGTEHNQFGVRWSSLGGYAHRPTYERIAQRTGGGGDTGLCAPQVGTVGCLPDPDGPLTCGPWAGEPGSQDHATGDCYYSATTSAAIGGAFHRYWEEQGGLAAVGLPLENARCIPNPDPIDAQTTPFLWTQWFERQRMEYHPQNPDGSRVLLGRLGAERLDSPRGDTLDPPGTGGYLTPAGECQRFDATGIEMCGDLLSYYRGELPSSPATDSSALELFGYPITAAFDTLCPVGADLRPCLVQYTERARLEAHYADHAPWEAAYVQLGLLGAELSP